MSSTVEKANYDQIVPSFDFGVMADTSSKVIEVGRGLVSTSASEFKLYDSSTHTVRSDTVDDFETLPTITSGGPQKCLLLSKHISFK